MKFFIKITSTIISMLVIMSVTAITTVAAPTADNSDTTVITKTINN